jgi:hypothetical protein
MAPKFVHAAFYILAHASETGTPIRIGSFKMNCFKKLSLKHCFEVLWCIQSGWRFLSGDRHSLFFLGFSTMSACLPA